MRLPLGYRYATTYAGIRKDPKDDVALIVPEKQAEAAAVFTTNMVQAAPVKLARKHLKSSGGRLGAVLINAGNANCATRTGDRVARASCEAVAKALKIKPDHVLPASTGVIGVELDSKLLTDAIPRLIAGLSPDNFEAVATAITTTDTRLKIAYTELPVANVVVRVAGLAKGAGMIHPNMATMLGFILTDADVPAHDLRAMLNVATQRSFNSLTVDGDMSTNDTLALIANGACGVKPNGKERRGLQEAVACIAERLAEQIAADGEGAKKLIIVRALGFKTNEDARRIARAVANSPLVKTAIAGSDANWGRILSAAGYSGVKFDPAKIDVFLQRVPVCKDGLAAEFDEPELKRKLDEREVRIYVVHQGRGKGEARFFTCDLTEGYIQINGSYRT